MPEATPRSKYTSYEDLIMFSCPLDILTNAYTALRLYFLSPEQRKEEMKMRFYY